ncbi:MAG: SH3 domain-containing protein [Clostridiales bacterium]|nr:SH3 domain-containing protein [Clostridiales bacterium]
MTDVSRPVRTVLGLIGMLIIASLAWNWWGEYREARDAGPEGGETTETAAPAEADGDGAQAGEDGGDGAQASPPTPDASGKSVVVLIEGLNFRRQPSREGELIGGLSRGTELEHLGTADGWHRVRDRNGVEGYVSASEQYTEVR